MSSLHEQTGAALQTPASPNAGTSSRAALIGAVAASVFFWASAYPAIRASMRLFSPGQLASVRFLVASLCFAGLALGSRPRLPRGSSAVRVVLAGALGIAAYNLLLNTGELEVSAGAASFLLNCMPIFAALLGICFLGERLRPAGWLGVAVSFAGVSLIATGSPGGFHATGGVFLVLGAAACAAVMSFLQKPLLRSYSPTVVTACMMWTGAVLLLPWLPGAVRVVAYAKPGSLLVPLLTAVYLGIFPAALGYVTWARVLRHLPLSQASAVLYLIPPVTLLIAFVWLGERASMKSLAGGALAIAGVFVLSRFGRVPAAAPVPVKTF